MTGSGWWALVGLVVIVGLAAFAWPRMESVPPSLEAPERIVLGREGASLRIVAADEGRGLRSLSARLSTSGGARELVDEQYPGSVFGGGVRGRRPETLELELDAETLGLPDGRATLTLQARDFAWRDTFAGNRAEHAIELMVDTRPPSLAVESGLTYVYRGGSGAAVYRVADSGTGLAFSGIEVAGQRFHGYPLGQGDRHGVVFAIPVDAPPEPAVEFVAVDEAGNESRDRLAAKVFERRFEDSTISLSERFLEQVVPRFGDEEVIDLAGRFHEINSELRAANEREIRERLAGSEPEPLWDGAFTQLANSQVTSRFAERRRYRLAGREISRATHFGFDLASTRHAPITASNDGIVRFAGELGIYGGCVLIDHGMGVSTLYGHLSTIEVEEGQRVEKGERLGASGETGLAGGDHLHFAILVGDTYVDPLEWWDAKWLRSHVDIRLTASGP